MEQQYVHLCVTREWLTTPQNLQPVRWITDGDIEALAEPLQAGHDRLWSPSEWLELKEQGFLYAGHFHQDRLCSMAGVWKREQDVWEVIAVSTKEAYRRMGLAQAAVHFVADYITISWAQLGRLPTPRRATTPRRFAPRRASASAIAPDWLAARSGARWVTGHVVITDTAHS